MTNIMVRLGRRKLDMNSDRDQRIYVSPNKETAFEKQMAENGYIVSESTERGKTPNPDECETMFSAEDPRGVWDCEPEVWRHVSSMDRGAATDEEIAYVDALDATYTSLMAMVTKG